MAFTNRRETDKLEEMQHPMHGYAADSDGVLVGRDAGEEARHDIERAIAQELPGAPIALDFDRVRSVSVPFADALLVPLLSNRLTGYYEDHPFLVVNTSDDVRETLAATLERRHLFVLGVPPPQLLGAEKTLDQTMRVAHDLSPFSVLALASELGISQQAANNRLKVLFKNGAIQRRQRVPPKGGREFVYEVPRVANGTGPSDRSSRLTPA